MQYYMEYDRVNREHDVSVVWQNSRQALRARKTSVNGGEFNEKIRRPYTVAVSMPPRIGQWIIRRLRQ